MSSRGFLVHCAGSEDPVPMVYEFLEQLHQKQLQQTGGKVYKLEHPQRI